MGLFGKKKTPQELYDYAMEAHHAGDTELAFQRMGKAAKQGHADAACYLGQYWRWREKMEKSRGKKGDSSHRIALDYMRDAALGGNKEGWDYLIRIAGEGDKYAAGILARFPVLVQDMVESAPAVPPFASEETEQSAPPKRDMVPKLSEEEIKALYNAGMAAYEDEDYPKARTLLEQAAEQGYAEARLKCAEIYKNEEEGTPIDEALTRALYWYEKLAEEGNAEAQYECGYMHYCGDGTEKDMARALYWFEKAAEQGKIEAQNRCGDMYYNGEGTSVNNDKALHWYTRAAEQGNASAQFSCAHMYYVGKGIAEDGTKALYWYEKAAKQGDVDAQYQCGCMYRNGEGTDKDYSKALYWLKTVAEQERVDGQVACGDMCCCGEGMEIDIDKARYWYEKAAAQGDERAKKLLVEPGVLLFRAAMAADRAKDKEKALVLLEQAAGQGHVKAQFNCGERYYADLNFAKALYWYQKAAEQGHTEAQFNCGKMYYNGYGAKESKIIALDWYEKAANGDHIEAQFRCGVMYDTGEAGIKDKNKAFYWYDKAAGKGHVKAQYNCAVMYHNGEGIDGERNYEMAEYWLKKAADQGDEDARKALRDEYNIRIF